MENIMKDKIMELVEEICTMPSLNCRALNKSGVARKLLDIASVPNNAEIQEIPLDIDNQVEILFTIPDDRNYYALFAGIGTDGNFHFDLSITGKVRKYGKNCFFNFDDEEESIPIDYFKHERKTEFNTPFIDDMGKINDMLTLSKSEFLESYSYMTEEEFEATAEAIMEILDAIRRKKNVERKTLSKSIMEEIPVLRWF